MIPSLRYAAMLFPIVLVLFHLSLHFSFGTMAAASLLVESGPYENFQFITISAACLVALTALLRGQFDGQPRWLKAWVGLLALGCFYIAGEEVSWGQHLFGWSTPEEWKEINDHGETNLHNTTKWLDEKPKILLELGVYFSALILPFLPARLAQRLAFIPAVIRPPLWIMTTALSLLSIRLIDKIDKLLKIYSIGRPSEVMETLLYWFFLCYACVLWRRLTKTA